MTERDPRSSLRDRKKQGGKEERRKISFEHAVSFPSSRPCDLSLAVVIALGD